MMNDGMANSEIQTAPYRKQKKLILLWLLILAACVGGVSVFIPENSNIDRLKGVVLGLSFLFLAVAWCHYDALEKHCFVSKGMRACLVLLFAIAFPIYLFRSRGLGGFKALGLSVLFFGAIVATTILAALSCNGIGYVLGLVE